MEPPGAVLTPQGASAQNRSTNTSVVATTRDVWVAHRPRGGGVGTLDPGLGSSEAENELKLHFHLKKLLWQQKVDGIKQKSCS